MRDPGFDPSGVQLAATSPAARVDPAAPADFVRRREARDATRVRPLDGPRPARPLRARTDPDLPSDAIPLYLDPDDFSGGRRARRILSSIRNDIVQGGTARVRQILSSPEEIYRIEVEVPDMSYVRTTLMGRDALTTLLEETPEDLLRDRFVFRCAL